jgi:K+-sensing histidine kinase KdpD
MAPQNLSSLKSELSATKRYGLAVVSVALALGLALPLERYDFRGVEFPLFLFAIALTVWYAGPGPGTLAVVLSILCFNYYFTQPLHSFYVSRSELPYSVVFILFGALLAWFSAVRRSVEQQLLQRRWRRATRTTRGPDLQCILYYQAPGDWHGTVH